MLYILHFVSFFTFSSSNFPVYKKNKAHVFYKSTLKYQIPTYSLQPFSCLLRVNTNPGNATVSLLKKIESSLVSSSNKFWDFVRKNRSNSAVSKTVTLNTMSCIKEQEAVDMFASHLTSVYYSTQCATDIQVLNLSFFDVPNNSWISAKNVLLKLSNLRSITSVGPDIFLGDYLYQLSYVITFPLWLLLRCSLDEGIFPDIWKIRNITPVLSLAISPTLIIIDRYRLFLTYQKLFNYWF